MTNNSNQQNLAPLLERIAAALEARVAPAFSELDLSAADGFVWHGDELCLSPVSTIAGVDLKYLVGIQDQTDKLRQNTERFARGLPANHAVLWGSRGMGKSSLVKAVHGAVNRDLPPAQRLVLIEIYRDDLRTLAHLYRGLRGQTRRVILFCDDLSFDLGDSSYKPLKSLLDGGIEGKPANLLFYATSNRKHLLAREMIENEASTAIDPRESAEEKISLSDRFGLWLGFYPCDQDDYLAMVAAYAAGIGLDLPREVLESRAKEWAMIRGGRSGRVAWQFIQDLAGEYNKSLVEIDRSV
ncbi:MAG: ATP-binding protein [Candidatus Pacebacteria bacterium]|nr:ATP-binding protein [Candidatus Paceibacterota bacterium]